MKKTIYIFSDGELKRKNNTIFFEKDNEKKYVPVENVYEICIFGEVNFNKRFLEFLTQKNIIMHFFNRYEYYIGSYYPREYLNSGYLILKQSEFYNEYEKRLHLAKKIIYGAIMNMQKILKYYLNRGKNVESNYEYIKLMGSKIEKQKTIEELMAIEGNIRENYYKAFDKIINNEEFKFEERTKRPPKNKLNALISFGNSLLYTTILGEIYNTHLDPRIGFLHTTNFRRFSLNLDIAEIFKPVIVDRMIFNLLNKNILRHKHFESKLNGVILNDKGKEIVVKEYEEKLKTTVHHKKLRKRVSYRRLIRIEIYKIEKHIIGDQNYEPFISEW